jgi:hypothetical protein
VNRNHQHPKYYPGYRSYGYPQGGQQQQIYPGLGSGPNPNEYYPETYEAGGMLPTTPGAGAPKKNILSGLNMNEISNLINRMGGIDGIINTMGKVQKLVSSFQQMAPMLKLVAGSFLSKKKDDDYDSLPRRRRRRKRRSSSTRRRNKARISKYQFPRHD